MAFRHRFLIDECLSPKLAKIAPDFVDVTHVNFRGLCQHSDIAVMRWCIANDHIVVTDNGRDFRRLYDALDVHPGVVIFASSIGRAQQCRSFAAALPVIIARPDLINKLVDIDPAGAATIIDWPPP